MGSRLAACAPVGQADAAVAAVEGWQTGREHVFSQQCHCSECQIRRSEKEATDISLQPELLQLVHKSTLVYLVCCSL